MKRPILILSLFLLSFSVFTQETGPKEYKLPKGAFLVTPTFNLNQQNGTNNQVLGVNIDSQYELKYNVNANGGYFIADAFFLGLQVGYTNQQSDITYYPSGVFTKRESYTNLVSLVPNIRNYFGNGIFKGFVQTNLGFSFGKGITRTYSETNDTKTDTENLGLTVAIQPGVALFVADFVSVELSINLIGLTSNYESSTFNDGTESKLYSNNVNFDVNILSLNIGVGFYLNTGNSN